MADTETITTADGLEVVVRWTCSGCKHFQTDTVHSELGPFFSCTCGNCGNVFENGQLSEADRDAWEQARTRAEAMAA